MKKILFVSSEAVPYVKTGGLADVVGSLPKYFDKKEYDVRVVIPKYACMDRSFLPNLKFLCHFYVNLNWRRQYVGIFESEYHGVHFYFVDNEFYFAGESPYNNIYEDVEKFAYFSKAVLASLPYIDFAPDIIHCNDWQTGLIPVFLHTVFGDDNFYAGIKTVFTIHNLHTTLIRPHTGFLPNARLSVESSSSPSIMQAPPNGNALMQYLVSPFCIPQIVGPRPKQNSFTRIPFAFASKKCPSS